MTTTAVKEKAEAGSSMAATTAWAIKAPDGHFVVNTRNDTEEKAWNTIVLDLKTMALARGYRCVRVQISEVQE